MICLHYSQNQMEAYSSSGNISYIINALQCVLKECTVIC